METSVNTKAIFAFLGGIAVGAALGILLAPDKGSETRKRLSGSAKKLGTDLLESAGSGFDRILHTGGKLKEQAVETANQVKEKAGTVAEEVKQRINA